MITEHLVNCETVEDRQHREQRDNTLSAVTGAKSYWILELLRPIILYKNCNFNRIKQEVALLLVKML